MPSERIMRMAVDAAREDIARTLAILRPLGPLPELFWRDPYVIGYLASVGGMAAEDVTDGRLGEKDLTKASFRALGAIAGKPPAQLRAVVEDGAPDALAEFEYGFLAAYKVAAVACGDDAFDDDETVIQARAFVDEHKALLDRRGAPPDETARMIAVLEAGLFVTYVAETHYPGVATDEYRLTAGAP